MRALGTALVPFASDRGRSIWGAAFQASPHIVGPSSDAAAAPASSVPSKSNTPAAVTTLERGGTAVTAERQPSPKRPAGVAVVIGAGLLLGVVGLAWALTRSSGSSSGPASVPSAGAMTYRVVVRAEPSSASIALDGSPVGSGSFSSDLARDGRKHTLTIAAPGFVPQTVVFRDEAPPSSVTLTPLANQDPNPAASVERATSAQANKKRVVGAHVDPAAPRATSAEPAIAGHHTDNIDPWEK